MKKKGMRFILLICFSLISVLIFSQTYSPIPVTGFNMDVVAEGTGNSAIPVTSAAMDLSNNIICTKQFATANSFTPANTYGLPNNGTLISGLRTYQMAPFNGNEVLNVFTGSTQTLTLQTPADYTNISLAVLATENAAKMNVVFNFSDGTNLAFTNKAVPDWFFNSTPALPLVYNGFGRLGRTATPFSYNSAPLGTPNLYAFDFVVPCAKTLMSISITNVTSSTVSTVNRIFVFAISGAVTSIVKPIVSNDTVCPGTPVTFNIQNPDPNQNYIWYDAPYNGNFLGVGNTYSPPNPSTSIIYYVQTINNTTGCPGSTLTPDSIVVASPLPPTVKSPVIACSGQPFSLIVSNPQQSLTYNWYSDAAGTVLIGSGDTITLPSITNSTNYYVQSVGSSNCSSALTTVVSNPASPVLPITGNQVVCVGKTIQLSDLSIGGVWSSKDTLIATINSSGIVKGIKGGIDTIKYIINSAGGCPDFALFVINVNNLPQIGAITLDSTVCVSKTVNLYDTTLGGTWVSTNAAITTITSSGLVTGVSAGKDTIRYIVTNAYGCTDSTFISFTVKGQAVVAPITGNNSVCVGKSITLFESSTGGVWYSDSTSKAIVNQNGIVTGVSGGIDTIWYKVIIPGGCGDSAKYIVNVNSLPVIGKIDGDSILCSGKQTILTATTLGGQWVSANINIATINSLGTVTAVSPGIDSIKYIVTNVNGCVDSLIHPFTVKAQPIAAPITGPNQICVGKNISLIETSTGGVWTNDFANISTVVNGVVKGILAGVDTIRYKIVIPGGCSDSAKYVITVSAIPQISSITGNSSICVGKTTTLTESTPNGIWYSCNINIATISSGVVQALNIGIDTIKYVVINSNGCSDSVYFKMTVNPIPIVAPITGNNVLCAGSKTTLSATTAGGIWVNQYPSIAGFNALGILTGIKVGVDTIKYIVTNNMGCSDSVNFPVIVNALPVISPITGTNSFCIGKSTSLLEATAGGVWVNTNPLIASDNGNGNFTGISVGKDTIRYIVFNGCVDSVFTVLSVNQLPVLSSIKGADSVCISKSIVLSDSTSGGIWFSTNANLATINNIGLLNGINGGNLTIRYIVTDINGCADSVAKTITIISPSIAPIQGLNSICIGSNTTMQDSTKGGYWSSSNPSIANIDTAGKVIGIIAGNTNITYTVNNAIGCTNQVIKPFTINPLPIIPSIIGGSSVCVGKSLFLNNTSSSPGVWASNNPIIASVNGGSVTGNAIGYTTIKYTVTDLNGCIDSTSIQFTVKAFPKANFILPNSICLPEGKGQFVNSSIIPLGAQVVSYLWNFNDPNDLSNSIAINPVHQFKIPIKQPSYDIKLSVEADGCSTDTTITMLSSIIHTQPIAAFGITPTSGEVCLNNPVQFIDNSPQPIVKSIWYLGDGTIDTSFSLSYIYSNATDYWVNHAVIDGFGCISTNNSQTHIIVDPYPTVDAGIDKYVLHGDSTLLSPTVTGDSLSYSWTPSSFLNNPYILNPTCTPLNDATFTLTVTGKNGCANSSSIKVIVLNTIGIPNVFSPNGDGVHDTWDITNLVKYPGLTVKVFNRYGQLVYNSFGYAKSWDGTYDGKKLPIGVYYYIIDPGNGANKLSGSVTVLR